MSRFEDRRKDQEEFRGDVIYQVWRNGGDPDRIDDDRLSDRFWGGESPDEAASAELSHQREEDEDFYHDTDFPCGY